MATLEAVKDSEAYKIYQRLIALGESDASMDQGYHEVDFSKPEGPETIRGKGDGKIEEREIYQHALDLFERNPKNKKYRKIVESFAGNPIPWSLDDFNPSTHFDEKVRERVSEAVGVIQKTLRLQSLKPGTSDYNQKMATALYYFMLWHQKSGQGNEWADNLIESFKGLSDLGLGEYRDWLTQNGGLGVGQSIKDSPNELPALEALEAGKGWSSEKCKILFAIYRMAGLNPSLFFIPNREAYAGAKIPWMLLSIFYRNQPHFIVGIPSGGNRWHYFDPAVISSHPVYKQVYRLSLLEFLSFENILKGQDTLRQGQLAEMETLLERAISMNPNNGFALAGMGFIRQTRGDLAGALVLTKKAVQVFPNHAVTHSLLGGIFLAMSRFEEARKAFLDTLYVDPMTYVGVAGLFMSCQKASDRIQLEQQLASVMREYPDESAIIIGSLFGLQILQEKYEEASETFARFNRFENLEKFVDKDNSAAIERMGDNMSAILSKTKDGASILDAQFERETGGADAGRFAMGFMISYALWKSGHKPKANEYFLRTLEAVEFKAPPSPPVREFIVKIFSAMPKEMLQQKEIATPLQAYRLKNRLNPDLRSNVEIQMPSGTGGTQK